MKQYLHWPNARPTRILGQTVALRDEPQDSGTQVSSGLARFIGHQMGSTPIVAVVFLADTGGAVFWR